MKLKNVIVVFSLAILSSIPVVAMSATDLTEVAPYAISCCDRMNIQERYTRTENRPYTFEWVDKQGYNRTCYENSQYKWYAKICQNCGVNHGSISRFYTRTHSNSSCPRNNK